jgi:Na+-transporting methylmalonyl-CoA/oxaloacetate decarboxylase gamma subunit
VLSDTMQGALLLSAVNLTVVFLVLGLLGFFIVCVSRVLPKEKEASPKKEAAVMEPAVPAQRSLASAAAIAAVSFCIMEERKSMFLRGEKDKGNWGKLRLEKPKLAKGRWSAISRRAY